MRNVLTWVAVGVAFTGATVADGTAQSARPGELLPARTLVRTAVADPFAARIGVALIATDLLSAQGAERAPFTVPDPEDDAFDVVAAISLGVVMPLITVAAWENGAAMLVMEAKVNSRFRLEVESRDDMGQDWLIGGGLEARDGALSGRALITHRSSHLGDEFAMNTGAERIEFGSEQLDVLAGYDVSNAGRVYGGGSWIFRSYLGWDDRLRELGVRDRAAFQLGADGQWPVGGSGLTSAWAGVDVQLAERTEWAAGWSAAAGIGVDTGTTSEAGRIFRLMLVWYNGPSTMGEFFLTRERYFGIELNAVL